MTWSGSSRKDRQRRAGISGWQEQRDARRILARDHDLCYLCGAHATQVDHVRPLAHGGTNQPDNLRAICAGCHRRKSSREATVSRRIVSERRPPEKHPGLK